MPINFNETLSNTGTPDVTYTKEYSGNGDMWSSASKGIRQAGEALGDARDSKAISTAAEEIGGLTESADTYYAERKRIHDTMVQVDAADTNTLNELYTRLGSLKAGEYQGIMTPSASTLHINKLVKEYSSRLPHLASQFRAMGSSAQGNLAAVAREYGGDDPVDVATKNVIRKATELDMSPQAVMQADAAEYIGKINKQQLELDVATGNLQKTRIIGLYQNTAAVSVAKILPSIESTLKQWQKNNTKPTEDQIDSLIQEAKFSFGQQLIQEATTIALKSGSPIALSSEDQNAILKPLNDQLDILGKGLKARDSMESQLKYMKTLGDSYDAQGKVQQLQGDSMEAAFLRGLPDDASRKAFIGTGTAAYWTALRLKDSPEALKSALKSMQMTALSSQRATAGVEVEAIEMVLAGKYDGYIGAASMALMKGESPDNNSMPAAANAAVQHLTYWTYRNLSQDERLTWTKGYASALPIESVLSKPQLMADIAFKGGDTLQVVLDSARLRAAEWIVGPDVEIDLTRTTNPIYYRGGVNPDDPGSKKILKLNEMFKQIVEGLGPDAGEAFAEQLRSMGAGTGVSAVYGGKPKPAAKPKTAPAKGDSPVAQKVLKISEELGGNSVLDPKIVRAFLGQESSGGTNYAKDAGAGARGPLQIIEKTFDGINKQFFNGTLSFDNEDDQIKASLALLTYLNSKHKGDVWKIAMEYYSGQTENPDRTPPEGVPGPPAGKYADQVVERYYAS